MAICALRITAYPSPNSCKSATKINGDGKSFWVWFPTEVGYSSSPGCADHIFLSLNLCLKNMQSYLYFCTVHSEDSLIIKSPKREAYHTSPCRSDAVRCLRRIVAGLLPERPGLGPGQVLVKFILYNIAVARGFSPNSTVFFVVVIITPCGPW
jgi:hypothetical protein